MRRLAYRARVESNTNTAKLSVSGGKSATLCTPILVQQGPWHLSKEPGFVHVGSSLFPKQRSGSFSSLSPLPRILSTMQEARQYWGKV